MMKVLLLVTDLFKEIGGGQTVYKTIIEKNPNINFSYFIEQESISSLRPKNSNGIPLLTQSELKILHPRHLYQKKEKNALQFMDQFAKSVAGQSFDIVDIPDYYAIGDAYLSAFQHHNVKVRCFVLAMHGNISKSIFLNWGSDGNPRLDLLDLEKKQFDSVDGIYSISNRYIKEWKSISNRHIHYIDPIHFLQETSLSEGNNTQEKKPSLYCVGRMERRKGNDLFVELIRWLREGSFQQAMHIGGEDYSFNGIPSSNLLENFAKNRNLLIKYLPNLSWDKLKEIYGNKSILIIPPRYDSLNLVALEALFSGCPVAISTGAGICDYLDETWPGLPYVKINLENIYSSIADIQDLIDNYDYHRQQLYNFLRSQVNPTNEVINFNEIYSAILDSSPQHIRKKQFPLKYKEKRHSIKFFGIKILKKFISKSFYHSIRSFYQTPKSFLVQKIKGSSYLSDAKFYSALIGSLSIPKRIKFLHDFDVSNLPALNEKLHYIYDYSLNQVYRCVFWREIASIERSMGNDLMAVTYELRILRLLGKDQFGLLPKVTESLTKLGYFYESQVANIMFSTPNSDNSYAFLKDSYQRNLFWKEKPFEIVDDRRTGHPIVSVIVSLYNAAPKLHFFLTALSNQTLIKKGQVEIILLDSGSPLNEYQVIKEFLKKNILNVVYARSHNRETIQAAWNRGIGLSKAPYLTFLGVDETVYPETLEVLANELDQNPQIDWVNANSLVIEVDKNGLLKKDVMIYDRKDATKDHTYLDTCYLQYVGGMYRKSIHNRFGYYDETFGGAGDTEFKNRILPYIQVKFIPKTMGLFLNYPDERTTSSPKAEIEDLRAWYIHRTLGGIKYAFENREVGDAEKLLCYSLGYRKSFCGHLSCDIEYATNLAKYIKKKNPSSFIVGITEKGLNEMLVQLQNLEFSFSNMTKFGGVKLLKNAKYSAMKYQAIHEENLKSLAHPVYQIFNDNRYEQHFWLWKSV